LLEVSAPSVASWISGKSIRPNVKPPVAALNGREAFVVAEGLQESGAVGRRPVLPDVPSLASHGHRREPRCVELLHPIEPLGIGLYVVAHVMRFGRRHFQLLPVRHDSSAGLRMLQLRYRLRLL